MVRFCLHLTPPLQDQRSDGQLFWFTKPPATWQLNINMRRPTWTMSKISRNISRMASIRFTWDKLDKFDAERYRYEVIHKLGSGGFATVWLAHDLIDGGYVALKIVHASQSSYGVPLAVESILDDHPTKIFVTERRRFFISGPNGHHVCQVLPVTGPSLMALSRPPYRLQPAVCKTLAQQATQALEFLHARGLCHGGTSCCPRNYVVSE